MARWPLLLTLMCGVYVGAPPATTYTPVSPAAPIHAALQSSLKLTQDWLNEKDFASAGQSVQELSALAQLYGYQERRRRLA